MRLLRASLCALLALVLLAPPAEAQAALPNLTQPVTDVANVIDAESELRIDAMIRALQSASGDAVAVVTVPTVEPYADLREYAVALFQNQGRGLGQRGEDNGVLIVLAVEQRSVWIEVGYGLEQWITDGFAGETSREVMIPEFRQGRYGPGLLLGTARIVSRIAERRNVSLDGVEVPATRPERESWLSPTTVLLIIVALIILSSLDGGGRRGRRNIWTSGVGPFGGGWMYGSGGWGRHGGFGGGRGGFGGGFGGFGGGRSGGGGGGGSW